MWVERNVVMLKKGQAAPIKACHWAAANTFKWLVLLIFNASLKAEELRVWVFVEQKIIWGSSGLPTFQQEGLEGVYKQKKHLGILGSWDSGSLKNDKSANPWLSLLSGKPKTQQNPSSGWDGTIPNLHHSLSWVVIDLQGIGLVRFWSFRG